MVDFQELKVTYGALDRTLLALGYVLSVHETHRLYQHGESGSVYTLSPETPMEQQVRPAHLLSLRHAVVHMGAADEATLRAFLTRTPLTLDTSDPVKANGHSPSQNRSRQTAVSTPAVEAH